MLSQFIAIAVITAALVSVFYFSFILKIQSEKSDLRQHLDRYASLIDRESYEQDLEAEISLRNLELESLNSQIISLRQQFKELDAKVYLQSIDCYEPKYEFVSSEDYICRLKEIKLRQERMLKSNQAYILNPNLDGQSKKRINSLLKLVKSAFENQCRYTLKEVKFNNIEFLKKKLDNDFKKYNEYLKSWQFQISQEYLQLKFIELDLQYELEEIKQQERERDQEIRKQNKEREAIEKARKKLEDAEEKEIIHQQELEKIKQEMEEIKQSESEKYKRLKLKIQELEQQIAEDRREKENARSESKKIKSGYIYIISNIGSLGENIYRICRTYRNNEDEYINNMNPSVPFKFYVHFKIFSEDALDTLQRLHKRFNEKRVNIKNPNREFFKVSIDEIEQAVKEIQKQTGALRIEVSERIPQAEDYYQTLAARKKYQNQTFNN